MADYAGQHGLDLAECVAYADSTSDLPMLEAAGYPVAVNPETKLAAIARKRGWHVEHWPRAPGYRRALLPFGPENEPKQGSQRSKGDMKALQVERSVPRFAMARIASEWKAGAGGRYGPLRLVDIAATGAARPGLAAALAADVGHLRERPGDGGRALVAVVRAHRELPVRAWPRGGGGHRGGPTGRH